MTKAPEEQCTGCRICEVVCSFFHEGVCNPEKSRITIVSQEPAIDVPVICRQCDNPPCIRDCPTDAIKKNKEMGVVIVSEEKCIGCGTCITNCPYGAIKLHPDTGIAIKCDLCGGEPRCVRYCSRGVLKFLSLEESLRNKWREYVAHVPKW